MTEENKEKTVSAADLEKEIQKKLELKAENEDLRRQLKEFGMSATEIKALKQAHDDLMKEKATKSPEGFDEELKRREAEIRKQIQKDLDAKNDELNKKSARIKELEVVDRVFQLGAGKVTEDMQDVFKEFIRKHGDQAEDGTVIFKDQNGKPRYAPGSTTQLMTPEQFIETLVAEKPSMFKPTIRTGTKPEGTVTPAGGEAKKYTPDMFRGMTEEQKNQAIQDGGAEAARAFLATVSL